MLPQGPRFTTPTHISTAAPSLRLLGRYDEALVSLDRALALRPNYFKALNNRGGAMEGLNRLPEALASYDRALAIAPDQGVTQQRPRVDRSRSYR